MKCFKRLMKIKIWKAFWKDGRRCRVRTCDPLVPNQMRYRAALIAVPRKCVHYISLIWLVKLFCFVRLIINQLKVVLKLSDVFLHKMRGNTSDWHRISFLNSMKVKFNPEYGWFFVWQQVLIGGKLTFFGKEHSSDGVECVYMQWEKKQCMIYILFF